MIGIVMCLLLVIAVIGKDVKKRPKRPLESDDGSGDANNDGGDGLRN